MAVKIEPPTSFNTKILTMRVIVYSSGTPVQLPKGVPVFGEIRINTRGNTGTVYLSDASVTAKSGLQRFGISTGAAFTLKVKKDLSNFWLDADNDNDALEIMGEVIEIGKEV